MRSSADGGRLMPSTTVAVLPPRPFFSRRSTTLVAPPLDLCTDNGAMIAWAGCERLALGLTDTLDVAPRARWPLDEIAAAEGARRRTAAYK